MKRVITLILLMYCLPVAIAAQQSKRAAIADFERSPKALSEYITRNLQTDQKKVHAIFRWVADNIEYKLKPAFYYRNAYADEDLDTGILKPLNERVAEQVLQNRVAFCDGYARLFSTLCSYAGIKSEVITGYAKTGFGSDKFRSNHTWNAVYIDSAWQLLDVTWASGYVTYGNDRFIKNYDEYYFMTPPQQFVKTHYPEDLQWTLLPDPPTLREFEKGPFKTSGFSRNHVSAFAPANGIIAAAVGDTLRFELQPEDVKYHLRIVDTHHMDSLALSQVDWWMYPSVPNQVNGKKVMTEYVVKDDKVQWLHVIYNNSVVLRYRVNIQKPMLATAAINTAAH